MRILSLLAFALGCALLVSLALAPGYGAPGSHAEQAGAAQPRAVSVLLVDDTSGTVLNSPQGRAANSALPAWLREGLHSGDSFGLITFEHATSMPVPRQSYREALADAVAAYSDLHVRGSEGA